MKILGIETSCDETAAAIVEDGTKILSNMVASSQELHIKTGGIIPEVAAREQVKCMIPIIKETTKHLTLKTKNLKQKVFSVEYQVLSENIDAIAVTVGPGLIGSLLIGVETAKTLAYVLNKPLIPINHLLAHIYANFLQSPESKIRGPQFPAVVLIVSGGHTELILMRGHGQLKWLGGTRDDAAGEAFDKIARLLELGYPGGPAIAAATEKFVSTQNLIDVIARSETTKQSRDCHGRLRRPRNDTLIHLPRPMIDSGDFDFSFSGLKTAVLRETNKPKPNYSNDINHPTSLVNFLAFETQEAITDVLVEKTIRAAKKYKIKNILLAGGVAANSRLREKMQSTVHHLSSTIKVFVPPPSLCTDNAACVASCAFFNFKPIPWPKIQVLPSLGL